MMVITETKIKDLVLIAGKGELPILLAKTAQQAGVKLVVLALNKETYKNFKTKHETYLFSPVEVYPIVNKIKELGLKNVTFIGKVPKLDFFKNLHKVDKQLLNEIMKLRNLNDDSLHLRIVDFLENEHGLKIIDQTLFVQDLFPPEQVFTSRRPNKEELTEINYGLEMAKGIAALDIGQSVVVQNKSVIAVEAIEGTNECIKRAIKLSKKSLIVCKVSKPNQDKRFDVPTVGLQTVKAMPLGSILAFEAGETFFLNQKEAIELAEKKKIAIVSKALN